VAKGDLQYNINFDVDPSEINRLLRQLDTGGESVAKSLNSALGGEVKKIIRLETRTDDSGVKRLVAAEKEILSVADAIIKKKQDLNRVESGSLTSLRQQVNQAKQARDEIARYSTAIGRLGGEIRVVDERWIAANKRVADLSRSLDRAAASGFWDRVKADLNLGGIARFADGFTKVTQNLQAASIVIGQIRGSFNELFQALSRLQQIKLTFIAAGAGEAGGLQALSESTRIASNLGVSLNSVRDAFQQLTPVIQNSGGTIGDVSEIVETLSSRFAAYGISGDRARRVTNGIIQAFAKGKLQAEELTQQISEADPAFKTDFARAVGISVQQLEEWVKAGRVTTDVLLENLPKLSKSAIVYGNLGTSAKDAADALSKGNVTIDQATAKLGTLSQLSLERLAKGFEPFLNSLIKIGAVVTDALTNISKLQSVKTIGSLLGNAGTQFSIFLEALLKVGESALIVLTPLTALVDFLGKIPGVTEAISAAILVKLLAPLNELKKGFLATAASATGFGRVLAAAFSGEAFSKELTAFTSASKKASVSIGQLRERQFLLSEGSKAVANSIANTTSEIGKYQKLAQAAATSGPVIGGSNAAALADQYNQKIAKLQSRLEAYQNAAGRIATKQGQINSSIATLTTVTASSGSGLGRLGSAFQGVGNAAKGLFNVLGPIGTALLAISAITAGYQNANKESNAILDESKAKVEVLKAAQEALTGTTTEGKEEITGFALIFEKFSLAVDGAIAPVINFFEQLAEGARKASISANANLNPTLDLIARVAAAAGAGAATGALIGSILPGVGTGAVALIGATTAAIFALVAAGGDAEVQLQKLYKTLGATVDSVKTQVAAVESLAVSFRDAALRAKELEEAQAKGKGAGPSATDQVKLAATYNTLIDAVRNLEKEQEVLREQERAYLREKAEAANGDIENFQRRIALAKELQGVQDTLKSIPTGESGQPKLENAKEYYELLQKQAKLTVELQQAGGAVTPEQVKAYEDVNNKLYAVQKALKTITPAIQGAKDRVNALAKEFGLLTVEESKNARTNEVISTEIKELQAVLDKIDPNKQADAWVRFNGVLAKASVELDQLKNRAAGLQGLFQARELKIGIESGQFLDSLTNAEAVVKNLEQAVVNIDINAPELPSLVAELEEARAKLDEIRARNAKITIEAIEKEGPSGLTFGQIGRLAEAYNQLKVAIPVDSPGADRVLQKLEEINRFQELGSKTNQQLQDIVTENQLKGIDKVLNRKVKAAEEALEAEKRAAEEASKYYDDQIADTQRLASEGEKQYQRELSQIDERTRREQEFYARKIEGLNAAAAAAQAASDRELAAIDARIAALQREADAKIATLEQPTTAEQQVESYRIQELRKIASGQDVVNQNDEEQLSLQNRISAAQRTLSSQKIKDLRYEIGLAKENENSIAKRLDLLNQLTTAEESVARAAIEKLEVEAGLRDRGNASLQDRIAALQELTDSEKRLVALERKRLEIQANPNKGSALNLDADIKLIDQKIERLGKLSNAERAVNNERIAALRVQAGLEESAEGSISARISALEELTNSEKRLQEIQRKQLEIEANPRKGSAFALEADIRLIDQKIERLGRLSSAERAVNNERIAALRAQAGLDKSAGSSISARISALQDLTEAEKKLAEIQVQQLRVQAGLQADTTQDLQAKIFLNEAQITQLQRLSSAEQAADDRRIQALRIQAGLEKASQNTLLGRLSILRELGAAEKALQDFEIAKLEKQAASAPKQRLRLEAAAQLERLRREKEIGDIEKQIAQEDAQAQLAQIQRENQIALLQKQNAEAQAQLEREKAAASQLSAQAQLERLERDQKIAELSKQAAAIEAKAQLDRIERESQINALTQERARLQEVANAAQKAADDAANASAEQRRQLEAAASLERLQRQEEIEQLNKRLAATQAQAQLDQIERESQVNTLVQERARLQEVANAAQEAADNAANVSAEQRKQLEAAAALERIARQEQIEKLTQQIAAIEAQAQLDGIERSERIEKIMARRARLEAQAALAELELKEKTEKIAQQRDAAAEAQRRAQAQAELDSIERNNKISQIRTDVENKVATLQQQADESRKSAANEIQGIEEQIAKVQSDAASAAIAASNNRSNLEQAYEKRRENWQKRIAGLEAAQQSNAETSLNKQKDIEEDIKDYSKELLSNQEEIEKSSQREANSRAATASNLLAARNSGQELDGFTSNTANNTATMADNTFFAAENSSSMQTSVSDTVSPSATVATNSGDIATSLGTAASNASSLLSNLQQIANLGNFNVDVTTYGPTQYAASGGPVSGGQTYVVNELGREGFLSSSGRLSEIKAPSWGRWTAPSSGTVIPAHIWSEINAPKAGVSTSAKAVKASNGKNLGGLSRTIAAALASKANSGGEISQLASVQSQQAIQIGKLSRAVSDLTKKNWNVNVGVQASGRNVYMERLTRSF